MLLLKLAYIFIESIIKNRIVFIGRYVLIRIAYVFMAGVLIKIVLFLWKNVLLRTAYVFIDRYYVLLRIVGVFKDIQISYY